MAVQSSSSAAQRLGSSDDDDNVPADNLADSRDASSDVDDAGFGGGLHRLHGAFMRIISPVADASAPQYVLGRFVDFKKGAPEERYGRFLITYFLN